MADYTTFYYFLKFSLLCVTVALLPLKRGASLLSVVHLGDTSKSDIMFKLQPLCFGEACRKLYNTAKHPALMNT